MIISAELKENDAIFIDRKFVIASNCDVTIHWFLSLRHQRYFSW